MNRQEFMSQLEKLLLYVPIQEREEALQYYNDYFEDAGEEKEQEVIAALGSPQAIAENIKRDIHQSDYGLEPDKVEPGKELVKYHPELAVIEQPCEKKQKTHLPLWAMIVIGICALPILLSLLGGILGVVFGLLGAVFGVLVSLVVSFGVIALVCPLAGLCIIICGGIACTMDALAGIGIIGVGFVTVAVGLLGLLLEVVLIGKGIPAVVGLIKKCFSLLKSKVVRRGECV